MRQYAGAQLQQFSIIFRFLYTLHSQVINGNKQMKCSFSWRWQRLQTPLSPVSVGPHAAAAAHLSLSDEVAEKAASLGKSREGFSLACSLCWPQQEVRASSLNAGVDFVFMRWLMRQLNAWSNFPPKTIDSICLHPSTSLAPVHAVCITHGWQSSVQRRRGRAG